MLTHLPGLHCYLTSHLAPDVHGDRPVGLGIHGVLRGVQELPGGGQQARKGDAACSMLLPLLLLLSMLGPNLQSLTYLGIFASQLAQRLHAEVLRTIA